MKPALNAKPCKFIRKMRPRLFQDISIRSKLLIFFLIVSLTPVTILGVISFISSRAAINRKVTDYSFRELEQTAMNLQNKINYYNNISLTLVANREGNNLVKNYINYQEDSSYRYALSEFLKVYLTGDLDIYGCLFIPLGNGEPFYNGALIPTGFVDIHANNFLNAVKKDPFYKKVFFSAGKMIWSPPFCIGRTHREYFVIAARTVNDLDSGDLLGVFGILTKVESVDKIINCNLYNNNGNSNWHNNYSLIIDGDKTIVASPVKGNIGKSITRIMAKPQLLNSLLDNRKNTDSFYTMIDGHEYLVTGQRVGGSNWYLLNLAATSFLYRESKMVGLVTLLVGVVFTTLAVLISLIVTFNITRPLKTLITTMTIVERGDLSVRFKVKQHDEVGRLGQSFNKMINKLDNLVNIVYASQLKEKEVELKLLQAQIRKREIELNALQAQINPHFIYNTLESIRRMADLNDDHHTSKTMLIFGKLLRYTIQIGNQTVTVQEEMEYLKNYLTLQNLRFNNKFKLILDIDPELNEMKIINLVFQPMVENAIFHGLESIPGLGMIQITGRQYERGIYFEVADNGVGIAGEQLEQLNRRINDFNLIAEYSKSIGLKNVNERIKLYYGDDYGIKIFSEHGRGTVVRIELPDITRMNTIVI